jgi:transcription antitermination factor NusB
MKRREQARQIALQALYQLDVRKEDVGSDIVDFLRESTQEPEVYFFARRLVEGAWGWRIEADRLISEAAENWRLERMATLDRNILRLAAYEISQCPDIPPRVAIDQAIELAKRFSAAESGGFVNGILDRILRLIKGDEAAEKIRHEPVVRQMHLETEEEAEGDK